jgi:hypothetical protein
VSCGQNEISEREKSQKCHIVCDEHRTDKRDINERKNAHPRVFKDAYDFSCENIEKVYVPQSADNCKNAEKAGERFEIEIPEIFFIGWHEKGG